MRHALLLVLRAVMLAVRRRRGRGRVLCKPRSRPQTRREYATLSPGPRARCVYSRCFGVVRAHFSVCNRAPAGGRV